MNTVQWYEAVWVLFAVVGMGYWISNAVTARRSLNAATRLGIGNGRLTWARFSVLLTSVFIAIELVFALVGINSMLRPPSEETAPTATRFLTLIGFLGASLAITYLAYRWRVVDKYLVAAALKHQASETDDLDEGLVD